MIVHRPAPPVIVHRGPTVIHEHHHTPPLVYEQSVYGEGEDFIYPRPYGAPHIGVNGDLSDERRRIRRGRRRGLLTRREAKRLRRRLRSIRATSAIAYEDGFLSWHEERQLEAEEQALNEAIFWEKRDGDRW